jgi:transcriptional adapter 2-alpha
LSNHDLYFLTYQLCKTGGLKRKAENIGDDVKIEPVESTPTPAPQLPPSPVLQPMTLHGVGNSVGYLPHRGDFETEWENEAETVLADMEFRLDDAPAERELKLKMLKNYNARLDQRDERKQFIVDRGLLFPREKKRTKEERDVFNSVKVFARFHSADEHEAFVKGLVNEQRLRRRIEQLQMYRLNGVRTLAEGEKLDAERKRREQDAQRRQAEVAASGGARSTARSRQAAEDTLLSVDGSKLGAAMQAKTRGKASGAPPLDVSGMDQVDLLSAGERALCSELRLIPRHYLIIKRALLEESFRRGFLRKGNARQILGIGMSTVSMCNGG